MTAESSGYPCSYVLPFLRNAARLSSKLQWKRSDTAAPGSAGIPRIENSIPVSSTMIVTAAVAAQNF